MSSQIPLRRPAKSLRKAENIVPSHDESRLKPTANGARSFGRVKSDSKLAMPSAAGVAAKSGVLAPTASSMAKAKAAATSAGTGPTDTKGEKRKREALVDRSTTATHRPSKSIPNALPQKKTTAKSQTAAGRGRAQSLQTVLKPKTNEITHNDDDDDKMQVSDDAAPVVTHHPVRAYHLAPTHHENDHDDDEQPAAKRQHTLSPPDRRAADDPQSTDEADEVAHDLQVVPEEEEEQAEVEQDWFDIDAPDVSDPSHVTEYVTEISEYLKNMEVEVLPKPEYIDGQPDLSWSSRRQILNWCFSIHAHFKLQNETWFLAVNIFDRFLSTRQISNNKLQLVGLVALFLAAKFEETYVPSVSHMVSAMCTEEELENDQLVKKRTNNFMTAERYLLQTLGWDLKYPSPMGWLRRASKADGTDDRVRLVGKYLMDLASLDWRQVCCRPSLLGASALWLGRLMFSKGEWTPTLIHYTTYKEEDMIETTQLLIEALLRPKGHYPAVYAKYASKKLSKASVFCRTWALQRWPADSQVDLVADLPKLKEDIELRLADKKAREAEKLAALEAGSDEMECH